jgi:transposase-like protein
MISSMNRPAEPTRCPKCSARTIRRTAAYQGPRGPVKGYECLACRHTWTEPSDTAHP